MIRIIVNGCNGKMGKVLTDTIQTSDGFELAAGVDPFEGEEKDFPVYRSLGEVKEEADVVIDFSVPEGFKALLEAATQKKLPVVVATTGLGDEHFALIDKVSRGIPVFQGANMSLGVNLMKVLVRQAAAVLGSSFDIEIVEKHHRTKRDAPSGTALALADTLKTVREYPFEYVYGRKEKNRLRADNEIGIHAVRGGNIVGEHDVIFAGKDELLNLRHTAYSKGLFAMGALQAAAYIVNKQSGFYRMEDMIAETSTVTNLYTSEEALVSFKRIPAALGTSHNIFEAFSRGGINIDMISQTITDEGFHSLSFSIEDGDSTPADGVLKDLRRENPELDGTVFADLCKVTVEGIGMETQSGVASAVFGILDDLGADVKAVTTSETKISVIIERSIRDDVIRAFKERYAL